MDMRGKQFEILVEAQKGNAVGKTPPTKTLTGKALSVDETFGRQVED